MISDMEKLTERLGRLEFRYDMEERSNLEFLENCFRKIKNDVFEKIKKTHQKDKKELFKKLTSLENRIKTIEEGLSKEYLINPEHIRKQAVIRPIEFG